jgi:hypothetical protein
MLISEAVVVALVLMMSSASAEAMEFGDRPGLPHGASSARLSASVSQDRLRRQIDGYTALEQRAVVRLKITDRPRPLFTMIDNAVLSSRDRPGRLSAEFSRASWTSIIKPASIHRKPNVVIGTMKFEDRPGNVSNRFKDVAAVRIKFEDHRKLSTAFALAR